MKTAVCNYVKLVAWKVKLKRNTTKILYEKKFLSLLLVRIDTTITFAKIIQSSKTNY